MLFIHERVDLGFNLGLQDMEHRESQRNAGKGSCVTRISVDDCLRIKLRTVGVRGAKNDNQIFFLVLFRSLLDTFLTLQVKGTCRCSHKALGLDQHGIGSCTLHTLSNGGALHTIPFSQDDNLFPSQLHVKSL